MFWWILIVLCLLAVVFAVWPLWRESRRLTPLMAAVIVLSVALSAGLYDHLGRPGVPSGRSGAGGSANEELPGMQEAVVSLEARLAADPNDIPGWKMLGRTQLTLGNYAGAADAYERAMALEEGKDAQTMIDLAIAIMNRDQSPIEGRVLSLVESALALDPNNPAARFYSGVAAADSGDTDTAAEHWEILLGLNPPENIRPILEQRIAEWRGEAPPAAVPAVAPTPVDDGVVVAAQVSLSDEALAAMPANANVFVIARDPAAPTPPVAVSRLALADLPTEVSLTDANSMVEGRNLSGFAEIELLARVSLSGSPAAATGDWFGSMIVRPAENRSVSLTIDQQVP